MKPMTSASVVLLVLFGPCISLHGQVAARQPEATSTISSPLVTAQAARDYVRFTALTVGSRMRLEILSQTGDTLYDSSFRPGNLIEWSLANQQGSRLPDGVYGCIVTVEELSGRVTYRRGLFRLADGEVSFNAPDPSRLGAVAVDEGKEGIPILRTDDRFPFTLVGHDGTDARIESTAGGLILHAGRFYDGESDQSPHMRLTPEGNLGIGIREPAARLDVAGLIRTSEGIQFPDGSILKSANGFGSFSIFPSSREGVLPDSGASIVGMGSSSSGRAFDTSRLSKAPSGVKQMTAAGGGIGRVYGTEGPDNAFYGQNAGQANTTGVHNSFFGIAAGQANTTGGNNSFFGGYAGYANTAGGMNSFFGFEAGFHNSTGGYNSFFGRGAGGWNSVGFNNSFMGYWAGFSNTEGSNNSFFGRYAGYANTSGSDNSFFGVEAGLSNTTGIGSLFLGRLAGSSSTGSYNTAVGANSDIVPGVTNASAIGHLAVVAQSNSLVLGAVKGVNTAEAETNVGIGVTNSDRQLTVEGSQALGRFRRFYGTADAFTATFGPAFLFERARGIQTAPSDILAGDYLGKVQFRGRVGGIYPEYGALAFIASDTAQNGRFAFLDRDIATERVSILNTGLRGGLTTIRP